MIKKPIYFDHAATTPVDEKVFEAMKPYFTEIFGNANSQHVFGRSAVLGVDQARDKIANLIGAKSNEVYFTSLSRASYSWMIVWGL